ncbi:hypothetical protein MICRO8M_70444 [Microbacterium sp. 8M]|nr:hypothetical protein MICRO8M_70444 [Microbacterium sp. 8M]
MRASPRKGDRETRPKTALRSEKVAAVRALRAQGWTIDRIVKKEEISRAGAYGALA